MSLPNKYYFIDEEGFDRSVKQLEDLYGAIAHEGNCMEVGCGGNADGVTLWIETRQVEGIYLGVLLSFPTESLESVFSRVCRTLEENGGVRLRASEFLKSNDR